VDFFFLADRVPFFAMDVRASCRGALR
jgi:hypothetical protein